METKDSSTEREWVYYSSLVPGYTEKYGLRDMRKRNKKYFDKIHKTKDPQQLHHLKQQLIDNNRPLARYVAEAYAIHQHWSKEKTDDAYQDCCYILAKYIFSNELAYSAAYHQVGFYKTMTAYLSNRIKIRIAENVCSFIPYDEELHNIKEDPVVDKNLLLYFINITYAPSRNKDILKLYFFGDPDKYILPYNTEDIAWHFNMSRGRIWQIKEKMLKKLRNTIRYYHYTIEDFIL